MKKIIIACALTLVFSGAAAAQDWYMKAETNAVPSGWRNTPADGYVLVSQQVRDIHEACPHCIWSGGHLVEPPVSEHTPTPEEIAAELERTVQAHLDAKAREYGFDTIYTAAIRAGYSGPRQAEGIALALWMDAVWEYTKQVKLDCEAGLRTIPTAAELIAELPVFSME